MKRFVLLVGLLVCSNGWTQVTDEIHERCKDVADYVGCVQVFTGSVPTAAKSKKEEQLIDALNILPDRIAESSLSSLSANTRPFSDALALASADKTLSASRLVNDAKKIKDAIGVLSNVWGHKIRAGNDIYMPCEAYEDIDLIVSYPSGANSAIRVFNLTLGGTVIPEQYPDYGHPKSILGVGNCLVPIGMMANAIGWAAEELAREGKLHIKSSTTLAKEAKEAKEEREAITNSYNECMEDAILEAWSKDEYRQLVEECKKNK